MQRFAEIISLWLTLVLLSGCIGTTREVSTPEDQFGHRVEGLGDDGRETIAITPPDSSRQYRYFPATYESVDVRPATIEGNSDREGVPVELLIKGAFPDACSELHDVTQARSGNLIDITLLMRRPQGAICASVLRPYRFYLTLDGRYPPGPYRIELNDRLHTFEITTPEGR